MARPAKGVHRAEIALSFEDFTPESLRAGKVWWEATDQDWFGPGVHPASHGMVIYAHVDGGFAVWDPARNHFTPYSRSVPPPDRIDVRVQVITATHSPLVLASLEPLFEPEQDALWTFDLAIPRSLEAEDALQHADALLRKADPDPVQLREVNEALRRVLPDDDSFWARWGYFLEQRGVG